MCDSEWLGWLKAKMRVYTVAAPSPKETERCRTIIIRSKKNPMIPTTKHAKMILAKVCEDPFWYSSHTNFPNPSDEDRASAAIKTIHPTPSEILNPAKIKGSADGIMIFVNRDQRPSFKTLATLRWSCSIEDTPSAVLTSAGQSAHIATVQAE